MIAVKYLAICRGYKYRYCFKKKDGYPFSICGFRMTSSDSPPFHMRNIHCKREEKIKKKIGFHVSNQFFMALNSASQTVLIYSCLSRICRS